MSKKPSKPKRGSTMSHEEFARLAEQIFPGQSLLKCDAALALMLHCDNRTIRRWRYAESSIPPSVAVILRLVAGSNVVSAMMVQSLG